MAFLGSPRLLPFLPCSTGPCYLHSRLTSHHVCTWEMCNTTPPPPRFADNLCFRRGGGRLPLPEVLDFPVLFAEGGSFHLRSARLAERQLYVHRLICWQPNSRLLRALSASLLALFLPSPHCIQFTPSIHAFTLNHPSSPPRSYLSLWPNVGLQMKQLDFHLGLKGIDMCCSVSGRTLSCLPRALSRGIPGQANQTPPTPRT